MTRQYNKHIENVETSKGQIFERLFCKQCGKKLTINVRGEYVVYFKKCCGISAKTEILVKRNFRINKAGEKVQYYKALRQNKLKKPKKPKKNHKIKIVDNIHEHEDRATKDKLLLKNAVSRILSRGNLPVFVAIGGDSFVSKDYSGKQTKRELHRAIEVWNELGLSNKHDLIVDFDGDLNKCFEWMKETEISVLYGNWFNKADISQIKMHIEYLEKKYGKTVEPILFENTFGNNNDIEAYKMHFLLLKPSYAYVLASLRPIGKEKRKEQILEQCSSYDFQTVPEITFSGSKRLSSEIRVFGNPIMQVNLQRSDII